jgi:sterol desaturase/sphingolipid hydroxylase (fatty acid hydroxylase superfamily)
MIAGTAFIGLMLLEALYWRRHNQPDAYNFKESLANVSTGFIYKVIDGFVVAVFVTYFYDDIRQLGLQYTAPNKWVAIILLILISDLIGYVLHLLMHKVRYAWCAHVTHHSSLRFNLSTAMRLNFLFDLLGLAIVWWLPLALIGFDKISAVVAIELNLVYQFFLHTQVVKRMPWWYEAIFNTPSHHRVHHGCSPVQIDKNFGGIFIIWDRLFGTFLDEKDAGIIVYGIPSRPPQSLNPLRLNLDEFFSMWADVWRHKDLRIVWKPPDWVNEQYPGPGSPRSAHPDLKPHGEAGILDSQLPVVANKAVD